MPYVHRNGQNEITGLTRWPKGSGEFLADDDPAVFAYRGDDLAGRNADALSEMDAAAEAARNRFITGGAGQA